MCMETRDTLFVCQVFLLCRHNQFLNLRETTAKIVDLLT